MLHERLQEGLQARVCFERCRRLNEGQVGLQIDRRNGGARDASLPPDLYSVVESRLRQNVEQGDMIAHRTKLATFLGEAVEKTLKTPVRPWIPK